MSKKRKLIVANWKMHGLKDSGAKLAGSVASFSSNHDSDIVICPPFTLLGLVLEKISGSEVKLGAQDCHSEPEGAYTGLVSAPMIKDAGCDYVILGHSEKRSYCKDNNDDVRQKALSAHKEGLIVILCVGEGLEIREKGEAEKFVVKQLKDSLPETANAKNTVIAYEPVWAIGTGKTPTLKDISSMHHAIKAECGMKVLYGGSVKPGNAGEILALSEVDGVLVGGASLKKDDFEAIVRA